MMQVDVVVGAAAVVVQRGNNIITIIIIIGVLLRHCVIRTAWEKAAAAFIRQNFHRFHPEFGVERRANE